MWYTGNYVYKRKEKTQQKRHTIFITGSRDIDDWHAEIAAGFIRELLIKKYHRLDKDVRVVCGDAEGIDEVALRSCVFLSIPVTVCQTIDGSIDGKNDATEVETADMITPRNGVITFRGIITPGGLDHAKRDEVLIEEADEVVAINVGGSSGTKRNIKRAREAGKKMTVVRLPREV